MKKQTYIHNLLGRLRVRTEAVRNNHPAAAAVRTLLADTPHVFSVETNPLTGSVTVRYDPARLSAAAILAILRRNGYLEGAATVVQTNTVIRPVRASRPGPARPSMAALPLTPAQSLLMQVAVPKMGQIILTWTIERALTAALAGLL